MAMVSMDRLVAFSRSLLGKKGVPADAARAIADIVVKTEAFGVKTHGLAFLGYADSSIPDMLNPTATPEVVRDAGPTAVIDGRGGLGQLALLMAVETALGKVAAHGIAMVGIRDMGWIGALGVYLMPIAEKGLLGQLTAQTTTCKDCAPIGGIDATFSTNPVALAFPTGEGPACPAAVADFSTASVSTGGVNRMIRLGQKAPERIFMDSSGKLGNDPNVFKQEGSILFVGGEHFGHKGYALSLWCEARTALSGGECNNPASRTKQNANLLVLDPEAFAGRDVYMAEMRRFLKHMRSSRLQPGFSAIRLPGERGWQALREARKHGVPVEEDMLVKLRELAAKHGLEPVA